MWAVNEVEHVPNTHYNIVLTNSFCCMYIRVCMPEGNHNTCAAMCIHGVYSTLTEAQSAIQTLAQEQPDTHTFVIDDLDRWLPILEPVDGARVVGCEVEEISTPENIDPSKGRSGSVCDVRHSSTKTNGSTKQKDANKRQGQLEDLIRSPIPQSCPTDKEGYAALRGRCATLRAFERKLRLLIQEASDTCDANLAHIKVTNEKHPEYQHQYQDQYKHALQEVGMRTEDVPFIQYLNDE